MNPEEEVRFLEQEKWEQTFRDLMAKGKKGGSQKKSYEAIVEKFSNNYIPELSDSLIDELVLFARPGYLENSGNNREIALTLMCFLSLNFFRKFHSPSSVFFNDVMPLIQDQTDYEEALLASIATIATFSKPHESKFEIIEALMAMEPANYPNEVVAESVRAVTLITASLPTSLIDEEFIDSVEIYLDQMLSTDNPIDYIIPAIDLFEVVFESVKLNEGGKSELVDRLAEKYTETFDSIPGAATSKEEMAILNKASKAGVAFILSNDFPQESVNCYDQMITFTGKRTLIVLDAIKKLTKTYFIKQIMINQSIQKYFNYSLISHATIQTNEYKEMVQIMREFNEKDRKQQISKNRSKKEKRDE